MRKQCITGICWIALVSTLAPAVRAQEEEEIETDRDSFTPAITVVGEGKFMTEAAYSFIDNRNVDETHSLPELLLRYGITKNVELRFGANYDVGGEASTISGGGSHSAHGSGSDLHEASNVNYGLKAFLHEQEGLRPASSVILAGITPTTGSETATSFRGTYALGWDTESGVALHSSLRYGYGSEENDHFNNWAPSVVLKAPLCEKWNVHAEYFGIFSEGKEEIQNTQYFSPGIHYLINPNLEVGVRTGWGLNDTTANFFSNVGFGWVF